ncbi:unnamed protein product [Caenorhabditis auriculariae]|uniref:FH2 domain-containing protein n=1 Tax=Caenorhabditis auriculariae TaxID=2777116 RepID=A0A8S1H4L5_9PELO|nr:unnamed protein product [Caenorhabditis auriculariae]
MAKKKLAKALRRSQKEDLISLKNGSEEEPQSKSHSSKSKKAAEKDDFDFPLIIDCQADENSNPRKLNDATDLIHEKNQTAGSAEGSASELKAAVKEFRNSSSEKARACNLAFINAYISEKTYIQRYHLRQKLIEFGLFSELRSPSVQKVKEASLMKEVRIFLNRELKDYELFNEKMSPINCLWRIKERADPATWKNLLDFFEFLSNCERMSQYLVTGRTLSDAQVQTETPSFMDAKTAALPRVRHRSVAVKLPVKVCLEEDIPETDVAASTLSHSFTQASTPRRPMEENVESHSFIYRFSTREAKNSSSTLSALSSSPMSTQGLTSKNSTPKHLPSLCEYDELSGDTKSATPRSMDSHDVYLTPTLSIQTPERRDEGDDQKRVRSTSFADFSFSSNGATPSPLTKVKVKENDTGLPISRITSPKVKRPDRSKSTPVDCSSALIQFSMPTVTDSPSPSQEKVAEIKSDDNLPPVTGGPPPPAPPTSKIKNLDETPLNGCSTVDSMLPPVSGGPPAPPPPPQKLNSSDADNALPPITGGPSAPPLIEMNNSLMRGMLPPVTGGPSVPPPPPFSQNGSIPPVCSAPPPPPPPPSFSQNGKIPPICSAPPPPPPPPPPPQMTSAGTSGAGPPPPPPPPPPGFFNAAGSTIQGAGTVFNDLFCVDFNAEERSKMEEIFEEASLKSNRSPLEGGSVGRSFGAKCARATASASCDSPSPTSLLSANKALSIEIFLKKLRPLDYNQLIEKLETNNTDDMKVDLMNTLLTIYPEVEELAAFERVEFRTLTHASDQFCWHIARKPSLKLRIELLIAKDTFSSEVSKFKNWIEALFEACEMSRGPLVQNLLRKCLQYGNYLNQGSVWAEAAGFSLSSLPSLLQLRGKGRHSNIRMADLIATFSDFNISSVQEVEMKLVPVRTYILNEITQAVEQLEKMLGKLNAAMKATKDEALLNSYKPFLEDSGEEIEQVKRDLEELRRREAELKQYLCAGSLSLQKIFDILEQSMRLLLEALKTSKAAMQRTTSMLTMPTVKQRDAVRSLRSGELLARKSLALKHRDLPVEQLCKLFSAV